MGNSRPACESCCGLKILLDEDSIGRTALSRTANVNYGTLLNHIKWMKKRSIITFVLDDEKIVIKLTAEGRAVAKKLCFVD